MIGCDQRDPRFAIANTSICFLSEECAAPGSNLRNPSIIISQPRKMTDDRLSLLLLDLIDVIGCVPVVLHVCMFC